MILIGLTGSIASGKSLVASIWESLGAVILDADRTGHDVIAPGGSAFEGVVRAFGADIRGPDGEIDRKILGARVFSDPLEMKRLEAIVHPALLALLERRINEASASGAEVIVVDAALIFEFGIEESFDLVVAVTTPEVKQMERLAARGLTEPLARQRIAAQWSQSEKAARTGAVIRNDGDREALGLEAFRVWDIIQKIARRPKGRRVQLIRKDHRS